jgi:DNA-binding XRE family transcriptional regulator
MISTAQIRAARGLLKWTQATLAHRAGLSTVTLNMIENEAVHPRQTTLEAIQHALEQGGVDFCQKMAWALVSDFEETGRPRWLGSPARHDNAFACSRKRQRLQTPIISRFAPIVVILGPPGRARNRTLSMGRVEDGRGSEAPSPIPAHQTGRADFPHPAFRLASL